MKRILVRRVLTKRPAAAAHRRAGGKKILDNEVITRFNPSILNLGDISTPCQEKDAVAAVFDLTGFTAFCSQVDSYLAIPRFLSDFLEWFFYSIRDGLTEEDFGNSRSFWADFPLQVKFLGDGILLVWGARKMTEDQICRIVTTLFEICRNYRRVFYPRISLAVNKPPAVLRCGAARGKVFTIGDGKDFVGHCINTASRLSHLGPITFCFPHRGFQVRENMPPEYLQLFVPKYISIRGVGDNELVWVVKEECERLTVNQKGLLRNLERVSPGGRVNPVVHVLSESEE
jgi:class 3 adenylate cyclase